MNIHADTSELKYSNFRKVPSRYLVLAVISMETQVFRGPQLYDESVENIVDCLTTLTWNYLISETVLHKKNMKKLKSIEENRNWNISIF